MLTALSKVNKKLFSFYLIIVFFAVWEVFPRLGFTNPVFFPTLSSNLAEVGKIGYFQTFLHVATSLKRVGLGFAAAALIAVPIGFILGGAFKKLERFLKPLLTFLAHIPPFILFPVIIVIYGIGEGAIYTVIWWAALWPIMFTTIAGVRQVNPIYIKSARSMGANSFVIFFRIVIPSVLSSIFNGLKTGMTLSFMMLIGAETLGSTSGMGWLIANSQQMGFVPRIYLGVILVAVIGLAVNYIFEWLENKIIIWKEVVPDKSI